MEREALGGGRGEALLAYWQESLAGLPTLEFPLDRPRPAVQTDRGGCCRLRLPGELAAALRARSRKQRATLFMAQVAAFQVLTKLVVVSEVSMIELPTMSSKRHSTASKRNRWGTLFSILGILFLVFGSAAFLLYIVRNAPGKGTGSPDWGQLASIFSGASSLALVIISLIVAAAALVQWPSLKADVQKEVEASQVAQKITRRSMIMIQKRLVKLAGELERQVAVLKIDTNCTVETLESSMHGEVEALKASVRDKFDFLEREITMKVSQAAKEARGRTITSMGFLAGNLHSDPMAEFQKEEDKGPLAEAVYLCQKGYNDLAQVEGEGVYMALNNLVYYSTLLRLDEKREQLLEQAREIKKYTEKTEYAAPYVLTFCRTIGTYGTDLGELKEAYFLADRISSADVTQMTKKEATHVVALVEKRMKELANPKVEH